MSEPTDSITRRIRIRFSKEGDLRFISHRDLVRAFERMLRRAGVALAMTQGFHPRPQMTFPAALALGIEAQNEVAEFVMVDPPSEQEIFERLRQAAPPGLTIHGLAIRPPQTPKAKVQTLCYAFPLAAESLEPVARAVAAWQDAPTASDTLPLAREKVQLEVDLDHRQLRMRLDQRTDRPAKPREVLAALGLVEPDQPLTELVRSDVQLSDEGGSDNRAKQIAS